MQLILIVIVTLFVSSLRANEVLVFEDASELVENCAWKIVTVIDGNNKKGEKTVLGLATGSTPIPLYEALIKITYENHFDWSHVVTFNLDEYVGLPHGHEQSYRYFMDRYLFSRLAFPNYILGIKPENIHFPDVRLCDGKDISLRQFTDDYEMLLACEGPIDIQILGIGTNGHIGFAEPGSSFSGSTMVVALSESTIRDNARFFGGDINAVPQKAITMGIGSILKAKDIILLATGANKAAIMEKVLTSSPAEDIPATALHFHDNVTIYLDKEAAPWKQ